MAQGYSEPVERLMAELSKLPGVGQRTAERLAYHLLRQPSEEAMRLAIAIRDVKKLVKPCGVCGNPDETEPCRVCSDPSRDRSVILVVETPKDLAALERCGAWKGVYHVLGGRIAPLDDVGPESLRVKELVARLTPQVREVVLGTNPDLEGDGTALYLKQSLAGTPVRLSRLARGLPAGSSIEYVSGAVLAEAVSARVALD